MSKTDTKVDDTKTVEPSSGDLDLIDDALEDEGKDDDELWDEIEAKEVADAKGEEAPDESGAAAAEATAAAASAASDDDTGKTGDEEVPPGKEAEASGEESPDKQTPAKEDPWADATPEQ
ncbi:hypothetical protein LCGC14_2178690, partial [marine sediment metagenome]